MEIIQNLHRLEFPECTRAALDQLALCISHGSTTIPGLGENTDELTDQIVNDYIFCQPINKSRQQHRKMTAVQELQIVETILQFYTRRDNEMLRHAIFKSLFGRCIENELKTNVLSKLISTAVSVRNANVLDSAAVWMQTCGCNSDIVLTIIASLVYDYCELLPSAQAVLGDLSKVSISFSCNAMTAMTYLYSLPEPKNKNPYLTVQVLELICDWLSSDPKLGLISLHPSQFLASQRQTLWTSPTKPNTQTPIPGLVRWCTKAPVVYKLTQPPNTAMTHQQTSESHKLATLWSRLHLAILQTIAMFPMIPGANQLELITLSDMIRNVKEVAQLVQLTPEGMGSEEASLMVNRMLQILQVALATGAFRCSLADLRSICQCLPPCRLLSILQSQHLSIAPPPMHNAA